MDRSEILKILNEIFIDTLDNDQIILREESSANDIEEWDSLNHIQLIVAIEKKFRVRFTSREIQGWKNVGEITDSLNGKLNHSK
jgi:acyl carrier protein